MSKIDKLLEKFKSLPAEMRFEEVEKVLCYYGFKKINVKGSHFVYGVEGTDERLIIPVHRKKVKRVYLKKVNNFIIKYELIMDELNYEK